MIKIQIDFARPEAKLFGIQMARDHARWIVIRCYKHGSGERPEAFMKVESFFMALEAIESRNNVNVHLVRDCDTHIRFFVKRYGLALELKCPVEEMP